MPRTRMDDPDSEPEVISANTEISEMEEAPSSEWSIEDADMEDMESVIMDSTVWNNFPPDLHEHILQFLPIPDVCRFRTVCRAWNQITTQLAFAVKARPRASYIFKSPDAIGLGIMGDGPGFTFHTGGHLCYLLRSSWELYDTSTQKFFPLSMGFLYASLRNRFRNMEQCRTLAADKGFICVMWSSQDEDAIQVANPVTRSVVELPPFHEGIEYTNAVASMVVAEDYSAFTLYVLFDREEPPVHCSRGFDSNVGEWRDFGQLAPGALTATQALMVGETLFALFWDGVLQPYLFAFDTARGAWSNTGVCLPHGVLIPQLATAHGRLFFAGFLEAGVMILEVDMASRLCPVVACIHEEQENRMFQLLDCSTVYAQHCGTGANVVMLGCKEFLVLTSTNGGTIAFDLMDREWGEWDFDCRISNQADIREERAGLYGMAMCLTLCPVPHVHGSPD